MNGRLIHEVYGNEWAFFLTELDDERLGTIYYVYESEGAGRFPSFCSSHLTVRFAMSCINNTIEELSA